jgi:hypothetical protein
LYYNKYINYIFDYIFSRIGWFIKSRLYFLEHFDYAESKSVSQILRKIM